MPQGARRPTRRCSSGPCRSSSQQAHARRGGPARSRHSATWKLGARAARARLRGVRSVVTEDAARTHPRDRGPARRRARAHGRPGPHAPAEADRAALRARDARRLPPAPAGHDRQAGPASRHGPQGRDARELSLVEGGAGDEAQALADGVGGPCPARDQGRDDLGARHRPRRAPIAGDPARRAARCPCARRAPGGPLPAPFAGNGMWIWELPKSEGGDVNAIAARARGGRHLNRLRQELGRPGRRVGAVQPDAGPGPARVRPPRVRVAVRLRRRSARRGGAGRERRGGGRRLPRHRRREPLRGPLRAGAAVRRRAAGRRRTRVSDRADVVPLRRLPPGAALLGLPRAGRRPGQPAAGLLEGHRRDRSTRSARARGRTTASTASRSRRSGRPTSRRRRPRSSASARCGRRTAPAGCRGGAGRRPARRRGPRSPSLPGAAEPLPDPGWPALDKGSKGDEVVWLQEHLVVLLARPSPSTACSARRRSRR